MHAREALYQLSYSSTLQPGSFFLSFELHSDVLASPETGILSGLTLSLVSLLSLSLNLLSALGRICQRQGKPLGPHNVKGDFTAQHGSCSQSSRAAGGLALQPGARGWLLDLTCPSYTPELPRAQEGKPLSPHSRCGAL